MLKALRLFLCLALLTPILAAPGAIPAGAQDDPVRAFAATLTTQEKVGQLFLITFHGARVDRLSDVARLVQQYRIGGVVLSPERGNFRNSSAAGSTTADRVRRLSQQLQSLALENPVTISAQPTLALPSEALAPVEVTATPEPAPLPAETAVHPIPLFIGLEQDGDGFPNTALRDGVTPLPSELAIGATWDLNHAFSVGAVVGGELADLGVNMLLGPSLDVLQRPSTGVSGDIGTRSFGGDPYWVGEMGRAYIRGVHDGSAGRVITVAKQFPGLGASDRSASEEVATVQKSMEEMRQIELAPFFAATAVDEQSPADTTDAMMTSPVIRYRGFQGNIRQLTRPIGLDADGMSALMGLPEIAPWRVNGLLVSGPLGLPAVRKFYDPQLSTFPHRSIAQDALVAGNDLIYLADFSLDGDWAAEVANTEDTLRFFAERYDSEPDFRARVDAALDRILRLKFSLYGDFSPAAVNALPVAPDAQQSAAAIMKVAQDGLSLIYPSVQELGERLPGPPLRDETMLIFTDRRVATECATCPEFDLLPVDALEQVILRLYGPTGSAQVSAANIHSASFEDLQRLLEAQADGRALSEEQRELSSWLDQAGWLVFMMLDVDTTAAPYSGALRLFLKERADGMRDKRLIVFALHAPYYLDTTETSKLTAYYALGSKTSPYVETAARALFREAPPVGAPPVDVPATYYDLASRLEPDPLQTIQVSVVSPAGQEGPEPVGVEVGSTLTMRTSVILDRNGHPVPDGTPITFRLYYASESVELPRQAVTTKDGIAETSIMLDRGGQLEVSAITSTGAPSTTVIVSIVGDEPGTIATIVPPTATPAPTPTVTSTPTATATATATAIALADLTPAPTQPSLAQPVSPGGSSTALAWGLAGIIGGDVLANLTLGWRVRRRTSRLRLILLSLIFGLVAYCAFVAGYVDLEPLRQWRAELAAAAIGAVAALLPGVAFIRGR